MKIRFEAEEFNGLYEQFNVWKEREGHKLATIVRELPFRYGRHGKFFMDVEYTLKKEEEAARP